MAAGDPAALSTIASSSDRSPRGGKSLILTFLDVSGFAEAAAAPAVEIRALDVLPI
jgi:hypothetical protein